MSRRYLTLAQAVDALTARHGIACSYQQLWRRAVANKIPVHRIGGRPLVRATDLPTIADQLQSPPRPSA